MSSYVVQKTWTSGGGSRLSAHVLFSPYRSSVMSCTRSVIGPAPALSLWSSRRTGGDASGDLKAEFHPVFFVVLRRNTLRSWRGTGLSPDTRLKAVAKLLPRCVMPGLQMELLHSCWLQHRLAYAKASAQSGEPQYGSFDGREAVRWH
jgi:hypothetical protein